MKFKISKNRKLIILIGSLILAISLVIFETMFFLISYVENNPPITRPLLEDGYHNSLGLVSHWEFDGIDNSIFADNSGNGNHGNIKKGFILEYSEKIFLRLFKVKHNLGSPKIVTGVKGNAIEINGKQWVTGGNFIAYTADEFTISIWAWRENDDEMVPTIMAKSSWRYDGWWLCTKPHTRFIDMGILWGDSLLHIQSGYELPLQEWHHISVTMNNVANEIQFFIDGLPYGDKHKNVPKWLTNWNHDLFIGDYDGSGRWPWVGKLDDARYFDRILSHNEIFSVYNFE